MPVMLCCVRCRCPYPANMPAKYRQMRPRFIPALWPRKWKLWVRLWSTEHICPLCSHFKMGRKKEATVCSCYFSIFRIFLKNSRLLFKMPTVVYFFQATLACIIMFAIHTIVFFFPDRIAHSASHNHWHTFALSSRRYY